MMRSAMTVVALFVLAGSAVSGPRFGPWGVDLTAMDRRVRPGDDFFRFANGAWFDNATIRPTQIRVGVVQSLQAQGVSRLRTIVNTLDAKPYADLSTDEKKLIDLYHAFVDLKQTTGDGLGAATKDAAYLGHLATLRDVATAMGRADLALTGPFDILVGVDKKNPRRYAVTVHQAGPGMSRDYFLQEPMAATRAAYRQHLERMFALAAVPEPESRAARVYALEAAMANAHWSAVANRDPTRTYNPMTLAQLEALAPQFPWAVYFAGVGVSTHGPDGERRFIVAQPGAFAPLARIFAETPVATWRDYLLVHYLAAHAPYLSRAFDDEVFAFRGTILSGQTKQASRTVRALHLIDRRMGDALGRLYVAKYFSTEAEAKAVRLVNNLLAAYEADIRGLTWMTPATRDKALEKLRRMQVKIGYAPRWRDYSGLVIDRGDLLGDIERCDAFEAKRQIARLDQPVDRTEWTYTPQTLNAGYASARNEIIFPAAILQPPFFDAQADDAVNYGAIGHVIGHEISHAFDDQGSRFDGDGALAEWWTLRDRIAFDAKARALGAQYDAFEPLPGVHVNGALTMGENIADNAGTAVALKAYHRSLGDKPAPVLDGFTGDQRFFLSLAQVNREKRRPDALRRAVLADVHAPSAFRVIGAMRNQDEWYDAFGVKPGDRYWLPPERRVHIW